MRAVYIDLEDTINEKVALYSHHWAVCKEQITAALSDAFGVDCTGLFNDIRCNVSLNPIEPRFLKEQSIEDFMRNSYTYCLEHEAEIRAHIEKSEQ